MAQPAVDVQLALHLHPVQVGEGLLHSSKHLGGRGGTARAFGYTFSATIVDVRMQHAWRLAGQRRMKDISMWACLVDVGRLAGANQLLQLKLRAGPLPLRAPDAHHLRRAGGGDEQCPRLGRQVHLRQLGGQIRRAEQRRDPVRGLAGRP